MTTVDPTKPQVFTRAADIWDAMYADCVLAKQSIELDQYILENDTIGRRFLSLFLDKAREGVSVHLLLDFVGSYSVYNTDLINDIVRAGGTVRFYNRLPKLRIFTPAKWFPRNHVKALLIDSHIAWVGSACIRNDMAGWRDTAIRLTGYDALTVEKQFGYSRLIWWQRPAMLHDLQELNAHTNYFFSIRRPGMAANPIYRSMIHAIRDARASVCIATPYLIAPYALRRAIKAAARRGVMVQIITNQRSDVRIADLVSASYFKGLLRAKIAIFAYQKYMLHAKVVIVDDEWASVGSTNIDYLSLRVNREANLIVRDRDIVMHLRQHFENDLKECRVVDTGFWRARPYWERLLGYAGRSIKAVL